MFQVRYYDYVNKDPFMKEFESDVFDFVRGLEQLQACYAALYKNVKITDSFVMNVDNLNPEVTEIKRAHLELKDKTLNNLKQYYVVSHDLVQNFEKEYDCMKKIADKKKEAFQKYALKSYKDVLPIELYNKVVEDPEYKHCVGRLLQCYTKCQHLCDSRNAFVRTIQYNLNALHGLEHDLVDEFKHVGGRDPMRGSASNDILQNIASQLPYFKDLINEAEQLDSQLKGKLLRNITAMQGKYRKDNRMDPNFYKHYLGNGTWDELLGNYDKVTHALGKEIESQEKELKYLKDRDSREYRRNVHIFSNPRVVSLASEKASLIDLMGNKKEKNQVMLTELEECMLKNGEDLGICVKHLEGVQKKDRSKVDSYINSVERHEKAGNLFTELYIALKKEREYIDREITSRKIEKAMEKQQQSILKEQEDIRRLQDQINLHAGKIKNYQSLMHENLKDAPKRRGKDQNPLDEYLLKQQTINNNRFASAVKGNNDKPLVLANSRHSEVPSARYYNQLKDDWSGHIGKMYKNNRIDVHASGVQQLLKGSNNLKMIQGSDLDISGTNPLFPQSGGNGNAVSVYLDMGFMKDRNIIVGLHTLKSFLHEKKKKEIEKLSVYDRTEANLLLIDLALSKFYENEVNKLIGGRGNLYKIEDYVRDKCDKVNYDNVVQNVEYHKGRVYPLMHYMTNYLRKQMDLLRAYYERVQDYARRCQQKGVNVKDIPKVKKFMEEPDKQELTPFLGESKSGKYSLPHKLTQAIDKYDRDFEAIRKEVVKNPSYGIDSAPRSNRPRSIFHLDNETFDKWMNKRIAPLNVAFSEHRNVSKEIVNQLKDTFNAISKVKHNIDDAHVKHELQKLENDNKKAGSEHNQLELFQLADIRGRVDVMAHHLLDYLKLKTKFCVDAEITKVRKQELYRLLLDNKDDFKSYKEKLNRIESLFQGNQMIDRLEKMDAKIADLNKWQIKGEQTAYGARKNELNMRLLELRDIIHKKQHATDFLLQNGARYDEHAARHAGLRQIGLDLNHRIYLSEYRDLASDTANKCNIDENINQLKTKLIAVHKFFKDNGSKYLTHGDDKQYFGYMQQMMQVIVNALDMCNKADDLCMKQKDYVGDLGKDLGGEEGPMDMKDFNDGHNCKEHGKYPERLWTTEIADRPLAAAAQLAQSAKVDIAEKEAHAQAQEQQRLRKEAQETEREQANKKAMEIARISRMQAIQQRAMQAMHQEQQRESDADAWGKQQGQRQTKALGKRWWQ